MAIVTYPLRQLHTRLGLYLYLDDFCVTLFCEYLWNHVGVGFPRIEKILCDAPPAGELGQVRLRHHAFGRRQHWHQDRPSAHKTQGKALSVFVPWNVDIPANASCGGYVPLSNEGVPKPWYEYPLDMDVGDMVVFTSKLIHCGGAVPVGPPVGMPRVIAFIAPADYNLHYNNTLPISPPPWVYAEALVPTSTEKCGRNGCRKKVAQLPPVCFMCRNVPVCQIHGTRTCSACDATLTAPMPILFEVPVSASAICSLSQGSSASVGPSSMCVFAATCLMPLGNTAPMTDHLPKPLEPVTAQHPVAVHPTPSCPPRTALSDHTPMSRSADGNPVPTSHCSNQTPAPPLSSALDGSAAQPILWTPMGMNDVCYDRMKYQGICKTS